MCQHRAMVTTPLHLIASSNMSYHHSQMGTILFYPSLNFETYLICRFDSLKEKNTGLWKLK